MGSCWVRGFCYSCHQDYESAPGKWCAQNFVALNTRWWYGWGQWSCSPVKFLITIGLFNLLGILRASDKVGGRNKMSLLSVHEERYQADPHARKSQVHIIKTQWGCIACMINQNWHVKPKNFLSWMSRGSRVHSQAKLVCAWVSHRVWSTWQVGETNICGLNWCVRRISGFRMVIRSYISLWLTSLDAGGHGESGSVL